MKTIKNIEVVFQDERCRDVERYVEFSKCLYFIFIFNTLLYVNCMSFYRPFVRVDSYIVSRTVKKMGFFERIPPRQKSLTE